MAKPRTMRSSAVNVKHSNKRFSKLQKRGKIKRLSTTRPQLKRLNRGSSGPVPAHLLKSRRGSFKLSNNHEENTSMSHANGDGDDEAGVEDMLDDDNIVNGHHQSMNVFMRSSPGKVGNRVAEYERRTREFEAYANYGPVKDMLPIKGRSGVIPVSMPIVQAEEDTSDDEQTDLPTEEIVDNDGPCSAIELMVRRQQRLSNLKLKIARLANKIIENPVESISSLKELRLLLDDNDPLIFVTQQKLVMVSLLEVFKDIIPGYRIRPTSELETTQKLKVKKDTRHLQDFENGLIQNYKSYLKKLEAATKVISKKRKRNNKQCQGPSHVSDNLSAEAKLAEVAIHCMCDLLVTHPHFNFRNNIVVTLVPFTCVDNQRVVDLCCKTLRTVYRRDKLGEISLEGVKQTVKLMKARSFAVPPMLLDTFLSLKIKDAKTEESEDIKTKKANQKNARETAPKLSKRQLKRKKKMAKLEIELLETAGEESKLKKIGFQTEVVKQVFLVYFRVLKTAPNSVLMSAVLEGLAKFSHLINVDFFDDLVSVLHGLIESGNLDYRQSLHCVQTVVTILSGQGEALNIDPLRFYTHLYRNLFALHAGSSSGDLPVALTCLDIMINKRRKKVSYQRVVAFTKRLLILSLQLRHDGAIAILALARSFMQNHKRVDILLDTDTSQAAGVYLPELEEPEYCNASSTAIWELTYLRNHYHPIVQSLALHLGLGAPVIGDGQLSQEISRKNAMELLDNFDADGVFKPMPPKPTPKQMSKQKAKTLLHHWTANDREIRAAIEKVTMQVDKNKLFNFGTILRK